MDYLRKYLTGPEGAAQPTGAETVETLCERAESSTLLDDRRDAIRALKSLSRKFRLEVGAQSMSILIGVLETDRNDSEITGLSLEALCNIMSNDLLEDEEVPVHFPEDLGGQFTEIFIKATENIPLLLSLLEEYDFHVRWPTVKLLTILLTNRSRDVQEIILLSPMGLSKLMDLLSDSREVIRNDALLLLIQLTKSNANIQKIVAFENAFERLLDIIREEGNSDGGVVVEDCLLLLLNLLQNNSSNQNFFKEGSFIQRLAAFFELGADEMQSLVGWSAQKVTNIHLMLQLVRTLVSPNNPQLQTSACQKNMNNSGLLQKLGNILMASGVPADVLTETINTVSEVIRGCQPNQEYFASVMAPSDPPRPAIVVLLLSMVNEKQPFVLRCAVLYCFQSFLYRNEVGQSQIVHTLLPTSADINTITAGQLLCGGLFSADLLSNWFTAVAMLHAVLGNATQKEQLLRVQLATSIGNPPIPLLQQCCNMLAQGGRLQTRLGLLMLLSVWLADSPTAVSHFLHNTANVPYLISQISSSEGDEQEVVVQGLCAFLLGICILHNDEQNETFNRNSLIQIMEKRIGMEMFADKLQQVSKYEGYTRAAKKPHLSYKEQKDVLFDYEFTKLFKQLEYDVLKAIRPNDEAAETMMKAASIREHESIVDQYKEVIRDQDSRLASHRTELQGLKADYEDVIKDLEESRNQVQQLRDQNALMKARQASQGIDVSQIEDEQKLSEELNQLKTDIQSLRGQVADRDEQIQTLKTDRAQTETRLSLETTFSENLASNLPADHLSLQASIDRLQGELSASQKMITMKETEVYNITAENERLQSYVKQMHESSAGGASSESTEQINSLTEERNTIQEKLDASFKENSHLTSQIRGLEEEKTALELMSKVAREETESIKKEQDDLLVLLADQDVKLGTYKSKLKELGQEIEDEEMEDDDEDVELGDEDDFEED